MDVASLMALLLTSVTGLPCGKFAHLFYRYAALIRNTLEERAKHASAHH